MPAVAKSVDEYLTALPEDRRVALTAVRKVVLDHLPEGYVECIQYDMIAYVVPHSLYPAGYHCDPRQPLQYAALASQKNHMALYLMTVYGDPETETWFRKAYQASGKKLDMSVTSIRLEKSSLSGAARVSAGAGAAGSCALTDMSWQLKTI